MNNKRFYLLKWEDIYNSIWYENYACTHKAYKNGGSAIIECLKNPMYYHAGTTSMEQIVNNWIVNIEEYADRNKNI